MVGWWGGGVVGWWGGGVVGGGVVGWWGGGVVGWWGGVVVEVLINSGVCVGGVLWKVNHGGRS